MPQIGYPVQEAGFAAIRQRVRTIGTSVTELPSFPFQLDRKSMGIYNDSSQTVFIGRDSDLTIANGFPIPAGAYYFVDLSGYISLFAIVASGTADVRVIEYV